MPRHKGEMPKDAIKNEHEGTNPQLEEEKAIKIPVKINEQDHMKEIPSSRQRKTCNYCKEHKVGHSSMKQGHRKGEGGREREREKEREGGRSQPSWYFEFSRKIELRLCRLPSGVRADTGTVGSVRPSLGCCLFLHISVACRSRVRALLTATQSVACAPGKK